VVRAPEGQPRGEREIHPAEAAIVQRIFRAFADGVSPKAIGKTLNAEGICGPKGVAWSPSTIHGHASRGTGILNNELYVGRLVWNRQRYEKDPSTVEREIKKVIQAIKDGVPGMSVKSEMQVLEDRKATLKVALAEPRLPALHPNMADVFRRKTTAPGRRPRA
jgi:Recombinase